MTTGAYTYGLPVAVVLSMSAPQDVFVRGYLKGEPNTLYFDQRIDANVLKQNGNKARLNMPISPEFLSIDIYGENNMPAGAKLYDIALENIESKQLFLSPADQEYLDCAEWLAQNCRALPYNTYKRGNVVFDYVNQIIDSQDGPLTTPARVDHETGLVEVAGMYIKEYSVPMIVFVMMHERTHAEKDTVDESECDINAANVCLRRGYSKLEIIYAGTKILPDTQEGRYRLDRLVNYVQNWS